jgi:hypothetical protein
LLPAALLIFLSACMPGPETSPNPQPAQSRPAATAAEDKIEDNQQQNEPSAVSASPMVPSDAQPFTDEQASEVIYQLLSARGDQASQLVDEILRSGDRRFIAVFIELLRASQIGLYRGTSFQANVSALEDLSGEAFGASWPDWVTWYGASDLTPPPGFTGWKGELLSGIDPGFGQFLQDDLPRDIRVEEIMWGGVQVDGIPALDNPAVVAAASADYLLPEEPVFGIWLNGEARAYPLRILDWHEMANDVVGGVPFSLAYCTLCGAGIAFDGRASDGVTYTFGSSGFLFRSNKLMYDRQTRTLWNQLTGEPVLGELVGSRVRLELLPIVLTSWEDWLDQHPDTTVLSLETGYGRPYTPGAAYGDYFAFEDTMFPVWQRSGLLDAKARVYALQVEGVPKAYPVDSLVAELVVNDSVGGTGLVLIAARGDVTVEGINRRVGEVTYNAGGEVRVYERGEEQFSAGPDPDTLTDDLGRTWLVTEQALEGPAGERYARVNGHLAYWFGWYAFFPKTLVYSLSD